jgi:hypothetical protein
MNIVNDTAVEKAKSLAVNRPISVPSATPIPPGTKDATPIIIDVVYVKITSDISKRSIPNDCKMK